MFGQVACTAKSIFDGYYQSEATHYLKATDPGKYGIEEDDCERHRYCVYGHSKACPASVTGHKTPENMFYCRQCPYGSGCYDVTEDDSREIITCGSESRGKRHSASGNVRCFNCERRKGCEHRNQYFPYADSTTYELDCPIGTYSEVYDIGCLDALYEQNKCPFGYRTTILSGGDFIETSKQICTIYGLEGNNPFPDTNHLCVTGTYTTTGFPSCYVSIPAYLHKRKDSGAKITDEFRPVDLCLKGYYCSVGFNHTAHSYGLKTARCPHANYARELTGSHTMEENCDLCPPGHRCPGNTLKEKCKAGYVCEIGVIHEIVTCPSGLYYASDRDPTIQSIYELCLQCPAGKVCDIDEKKGPAVSKSDGKDLQLCPEGYRCGIQTSNPQAYPSDPGTYIEDKGIFDHDSMVCPKNAYCPPGSEKPLICPVSSL